MFPRKLLVFLLIIALTPITVIADTSIKADTRYLYVQKGQTLHNIVKRLYPDRVRDWPKITDDFVRQNPHAFIANDPTRMKAGVRLKLPQKSIVRAVPAKPGKKLKAKSIGVVIESSGSVIAVDKEKNSRKLYEESPVYIGDKVITGEDGFVRLRMIDEAILDLRCYSIMVFEDYAINKANRRSILNLLQGSLRKITGKIGKMSEDTYELKTPVASIGVRGTEYALRVFQSRGCSGTVDADDGLYVEVIKGLVDVHNKSGKAVAAKGDTIYVALPESKPRKEKIKPGVLSPLTTSDKESAADDYSLWWLLLGVVGVVLLI